MSWFFTNVIAAFLLPPLSLLIILMVGLMIHYRHPKAAQRVFMTTFLLLWLASTPFIAEDALHILEAQTTPLTTHPSDAGAIVILGGGTYFNAPEYGGHDTSSEATLVRLRYGARLHHETTQPILTTGGNPAGNLVSEAQQMRDALENDFKVPVRWTEDTSNNTLDNAQNSFRILHKHNIRKIYLVTHAWHMARAASIFRKAGFDVIEAPTAFTTRHQLDLLAFLPDANALRNSKIFVHEVIGLLWYYAKGITS